MVIKGIQHIGIDTENIEESIRFYTEILGLEMLERADLGADQAVYIKINEDSVLELFVSDFQKGHRENTAGIRHMAFMVDELETWHQRLNEKGVKIILEPVEIKAIHKKVMLFQAPDDVVIEFTTPIKQHKQT